MTSLYCLLFWTLIALLYFLFCILYLFWFSVIYLLIWSLLFRDSSCICFIIIIIIVIIIMKIAAHICAICAVVPIWCWHTTSCVCVAGGDRGQEEGGMDEFEPCRPAALFIFSSLHRAVCWVGMPPEEGAGRCQVGHLPSYVFACVLSECVWVCVCLWNVCVCVCEVGELCHYINLIPKSLRLISALLTHWEECVCMVCVRAWNVCHCQVCSWHSSHTCMSVYVWSRLRLSQVSIHIKEAV